MTGVLAIDDEGNNEVDFLILNNFHLADDGWRPRVARQNDLGEYEDVVEQIQLNWGTDDDDVRDSQLWELQKHAEQARRYVRRRLLSGMSYLKASTHSETNTRYSVIKDLWLGDLSARHWGPDQPVDLVVNILREGLWRGVEPGTTGYTNLYTTERLRTYVDTNGENYLDIDAGSDIPGDAPAMAIFKIDPNYATYNRFLLATRSGTFAELSAFNPFFNADDELDNTGSQVANTNAPNDVALSFSGSTDVTLRWVIPAADVEHYSGNYLVYAVGRAGADDQVTVQFKHGGSDLALEEIGLDNYGGGDVAFLYMGRTRIPDGSVAVPGLDYNGAYTLKLDINKNGNTVDVVFFTLILVPIDEQVFRAHAEDTLSVPRVILDGVIEKSSYANTSDELISATPVSTYGQYIVLPPLLDASAAPRYHRIYIFNSRLDVAGSGEEYYQTGSQYFDVTLDIVPRYTALRGDDV